MERDELNEYRARREAEANAKRLPQLQAVKERASQMSALMADPRWEVYGRHIEAERAKNEASAKAQERALMDMTDPLSPQDELKAKLRLAHNRGATEAYGVALNIAKILIEQGDKAEEQIRALVKIG